MIIKHARSSSEAFLLMISKHARSNSEVFLLMVSKHAGYDSEAFQLWPFRPACVQNWASFCIWFGSGFPKKAWIILSDLDDQVSFGPNTSCSEASRCARIIRPDSGRMQWAHYHFPTFILGCIVPQTSWIILCRTSPDPVWFWLTQFWPSRSSPEASQCTRTTWPTSGQRFQADLDWMQISSGILLGSVLCCLFDKVQGLKSHEVSLHCHWWKMANDIIYAEFLSIYIFYIPKTLLSQLFPLLFLLPSFVCVHLKIGLSCGVFGVFFCEKENGFIFVGTRVRLKFSVTLYLQETGRWLRSPSLSFKLFVFSLCFVLSSLIVQTLKFQSLQRYIKWRKQLSKIIF